ncbi:phenylacetate--CoA ligase family protein [Aureitalea marina]|uniref:phenylacetate--CoA ligase family protein n=1 Tax=Aureitalea marina TaxID=930804 RepID=UPI0026C7509D
MLDLSLKVNGYPIKRAISVLRAIQHQGELERSGHLHRRRQSILNYHLENNPFYRDFLGSGPVNDWDKLPVLTKADLRLPLSKRLSKGFGRHNVHIHKTSGSSGHPLIFAKDKFCHAMAWAVNQNRFGWHGIDQNKDLQARFYGIPLDWKGYQKERLKDRLSSRYRFPIFDLSDQKMEEFVGIFAKRPFVYINGYTSSIVLFAKYLERENIQIKSLCPTLTHCFVTSEMLFDSDKELLERVLQVPVINEYGASELDLIAFSHPDGDFRLNNETQYVEILDENDHPLPAGQAGRIVITNFYNWAHPMIRYDIGDTGIIAPSTHILRPGLDQLIGRTNDVAILPDGKRVPGLTFYYVTKSLIEDNSPVEEFVIEQHQADVFKILYTSQRDLDRSETKAIEGAILTYLGQQVQLSIERVEVMDRSRRGKLKQFISYL